MSLTAGTCHPAGSVHFAALPHVVSLYEMPLYMHYGGLLKVSLESNAYQFFKCNLFQT